MNKQKKLCPYCSRDRYKICQHIEFKKQARTECMFIKNPELCPLYKIFIKRLRTPLKTSERPKK